MIDPAPAQSTFTALSDEALGRRFANAEPGAVDELYGRWAVRIHDFVAGMVHDPALAEDLTQATFVRAMEARTTLRDPAKIRAWLYAIARNLALKQIARRPPTYGEEALLNVAAEGNPADELERKGMADLIWNAATSLEPRQYTVLTLMVRHGLEAAEVGDILGVSPNHAYVLTSRAKQALGKAVQTLLLARSRRDCNRLNSLLPDDVSTLTPEQHRTIEHHLRRCQACKIKTRQLTTAASLFAAIPLMALPSRLRSPQSAFQATPASVRLAASPHPDNPTRRRPPRTPMASMLPLLLVPLLLLPLIGRVPGLHVGNAPAATTSNRGHGSLGHDVSHPLIAPASTPIPDTFAAELIAKSEAALRQVSSYHVYALGSPEIESFSLDFNGSGDFVGKLTVRETYMGIQRVGRRGGIIYYANGIGPPPGIFGISAPQVKALGSNWFPLTAPPQQAAARIIADTVAPYATPDALISTLFPPGVTPVGRSSGGFQSQVHVGNGLLIQLSNGTAVAVDATTFLPIWKNGAGAASLQFSGFNTPIDLVAQAPLLAI